MSVHVLGAGMTALGKHLDRSVKELTAEVVTAALTDVGAERGAIEAAWFCNTRQGAP